MNILQNKVYQLIFYPFSLIYGMIIRFRNQLYDKKIFRSLKVENVKIISVGNITVGGTGKTPVTKFLAILLRDMGFKVAILSRGYGRKSKKTVVVSDGKKILVRIDHAGDEPFLLARQLKNIPVVVEADRYKGALLIQKKFYPDIILLDDGYQHRRLHRDFNILLIDASSGFGDGLLLPAGFLREPITSLKRADLIWLTRIDQAENLNQLIKIIQNFSSSPIMTSYHQTVEIIQAGTGNRADLSFLNQKQVFLFSGIANPKSFEKAVTDSGANIVYHLKFADHYDYKDKDISKIIYKAQNTNADLILTTEKDYVRLSDLIHNFSKIYFLTIEIRIGDYFEILKNKLSSVLYKSSE